MTDLLPHLFRTEFSRITVVLCKLLGVEHLQTAEDLAAEAFLSAVETWPYKGIPENPAAWLYTVAKNKAKNHISRTELFRSKVAPVARATQLFTEDPLINLSAEHIADSQLQMLFVVSHPSLAAEAQISLALRLLCGLGIDEIANALLTNKETIAKRLYRAREKLKQLQIKIELPAPSEINNRLDMVLTTLYLLFSEGYYSESNNTVIREELCVEAMRLTYMLIENENTNTPKVNALLALMCFHSSRFKARMSQQGEIILYHDQDETLWDQDLIARGAYFLHQASRGDALSKYHIEAGIAYWHTIKEDTPEKWDNILQLFNKLLRIAYSPVAALNRTYAFSKVHGRQAAIAAAEQLQLSGNHYYHTLLGELYTTIDQTQALAHLQQALKLAVTEADQQTIANRIKHIK